MRLAQRLFELLFSNVSKSDLQAIEDTVAFWEDTLMCIQQRRRQCLDHLRRTVCACIHHYAVETMRVSNSVCVRCTGKPDGANCIAAVCWTLLMLLNALSAQLPGPSSGGAERIG